MKATFFPAGAVFVLLLIQPLAVGARDFVTIKSGDWFDPTVWAPTPYPFDGDNATIATNAVNLYFYNNLLIQLNNLNLSNGTLTIFNMGGQGGLMMLGGESYWANSSVSHFPGRNANVQTISQFGTLLLMESNQLNVLLGFTNHGIVRQIDPGTLHLHGSAFVVNCPEAVYDFADDGGIVGDSGSTFTNRGTVLKSGGVNTSTVALEFINSGGTIEVDSGTLTIQFNLLSSNGTFVVRRGAALDPFYGFWSGKITGCGAGKVVLRNGTLYASPSLTLDFSDSLFQWISGTIMGSSGGLTNLGGITLSGGNSVSLTGLVNGGIFRHSNTASLNLSQIFENLSGGIYDAEDSGQFNGGTFVNFGMFRRSSGSGVFSMMPRNFYNYGGTIEADSGTLNFGSAGFFQTNGVTRLAGGNLSGNQLNFYGGILTGVGSITGTVVNAAAVVPGNNGLGSLRVTGSYIQTTNGALDIVLGGTGTDQFGQLNVVVNNNYYSSASLAGTLNLSPANSFTPAIGDQFQILSCAKLSGTFTLPPTFPAGIEVTYSNHGVFLTVTGAVIWPTPPTFRPPVLREGNLNFGFQTISGQSYTLQTNDDLTEAAWGDFISLVGNGSTIEFAVPVTNVPTRLFRLRQP